MVGQGFQVAVVVVLAILLKLNILGSIFNGKIVFEKNEPRTATLSPLVSLIVGEPSVYKAYKTKQPSDSSESCREGRMMGLEPTTLGTTIRCSTS